LSGIAGFVGREDQALLSRMAEAIAHRGRPFCVMLQDEHVALCNRWHRTDSPSVATEVVRNEDRSLSIVLDGEVYDYDEQRDQLARRGHVFRTETDAELLLHLYEEDGEEFPYAVDGVFALAIWDSARNVLFLARDRLGVKPLYYCFYNDGLHFASEIKALLVHEDAKKDVNRQALHYFLNLGSVPGRDTMVEGIYELLPGSVLTWRGARAMRRRYWEPAIETGESMEEADCAENLLSLLTEAVRKRVPRAGSLGVFLSSGVDSSAVAALATPHSSTLLKTFTIGLSQSNDELEDARVFAESLGTEHHDAVFSKYASETIPKMVWANEGLSKHGLTILLASEFAAKHVDTCLCGTAGDTNFAGSSYYRLFPLCQRIERFLPQGIAKATSAWLGWPLAQMQASTAFLGMRDYLRGLQLLTSLRERLKCYLIIKGVWDVNGAAWRNVYSTGYLQQSPDIAPTEILFDRYFSDENEVFLDQARVAAVNTTLVSHYLLMEDRMNALAGLKTRCPFLDTRLVEFAQKIPPALKIKGRQTKYILKRALMDILPATVLSGKKRAFGYQPHVLFERELRSIARKVLTRRRIESQGFFNFDYIEAILNHAPHPRLRWHYNYLLNLVSFQIWYQMYIESHDFAHTVQPIEAYYG
jgi:asparagine synthase (glutamine-hydrolysing)